MAETLGSLCDKLTVVKLKQWHSEDQARLDSLALQSLQLQQEINEFISLALCGGIASERLQFAANKVTGPRHQHLPEIDGTIGEIVGLLAQVNCQLWHQQEKVYAFEAVPPSDKDTVIHELARLNLQRNQCIDRIDRSFAAALAPQSAACP